MLSVPCSSYFSCFSSFVNYFHTLACLCANLLPLIISSINIPNVLQVAIMSVEKSIHEMLQHQNHMRGTEQRDYNLISDNNTYVQNWSVAQILVITATTVLQVHFVRKLFDIKSSRPRA